MKTILGQKALKNISLVKEKISISSFENLEKSIKVFDEDLSKDLNALTYDGIQAKTKLTNISEFESSVLINFSNWIS
jgi:hypothetical protein